MRQTARIPAWMGATCLSFLAATNLVSGRYEWRHDAYVRDTCAGVSSGCTPSTQLVSISTGAVQANGADHFSDDRRDGPLRDVRIDSDESRDKLVVRRNLPPRYVCRSLVAPARHPQISSSRTGLPVRQAAFRVCVRTQNRHGRVAPAFKRALWNQANASLKASAT